MKMLGIEQVDRIKFLYFAGQGRETHLYIIIIKGVPQLSWLNGDNSHSFLMLFQRGVVLVIPDTYTYIIIRIELINYKIDLLALGILSIPHSLRTQLNSLMLDFRQTSILISEHRLACLRPPKWNRILRKKIGIRTSYPRLRVSV